MVHFLLLFFKEFVPNLILPVAERVREKPVVSIPEAQRVVDTAQVEQMSVEQTSLATHHRLLVDIA